MGDIKDLEDGFHDELVRALNPAKSKPFKEALQQALDETTVDTSGDPLDTRDAQSDDGDWAGWIAKCLRENE